MFDFAIVGGGIVGLSVGVALYNKYPNAKVLLLEKEGCLAKHQTGHNSGVIHSGIYYKPGSYKAKFAREGSNLMVEFCNEHQIDHEICGKVIVATNKEELPLLEKLYERGLQNELKIKKVSAEQLKELEPHVNGLAAVHVPMAGIVNYQQVSEKFAQLIEASGAKISLNTSVENINEANDCVTIETSKGTFKSKLLINCAGLHSDRIAKLAGYITDMKIVPFRGEYFQLKPEKRYLVKNLIYPVPNPKFPFLGVHFTRMIDGTIEAGPNAVLSLKREGYYKKDINVKDIIEVLTYRGFWKLANKHMKEGLEEVIRSFNKAKFVESLQLLVPDIQGSDLEPAPAGVRAQALKPDGRLVDDFHIIMGKKCIHVCNAPSPAATASIRIGIEVVDKISKRITLHSLVV
ncbi:L-2-hydroxyglutarate oxidase [Alkalihalobacillus sp. BA299]|uniref:L-2-hydroxyglutarate oxidase n=1 Tax=Alkalihalobacillus sp. BA299 TaxID=2815938 RepID=UPI001ADBD71A|nr:L-2-hydroxyglutarate oxidase [Alkalihalobacillus sp. BA299]